MSLLAINIFIVYFLVLYALAASACEPPEQLVWTYSCFKLLEILVTVTYFSVDSSAYFCGYSCVTSAFIMRYMGWGCLLGTGAYPTL
jgi:hypothetical protein